MKNLKLNKDKMKLRRTEVKFMGHILAQDGLRADDETLRAFSEMPTPCDKQGVSRILGMINYLQRYSPNLSSISKPLRDLLIEDTFSWNDDVHGSSLEAIKHALTSEPVLLRYFDPEKEVTLQCDASKSGLGACIMQDGQP